MTSAHQMASRPPATKQAATGTRSWRQDDLLADAVAQTGRGQGDWRLVQVWPQGHGVGLAGRWRYASRWSLPATWQLRRTRPLPATRTNRRLVVTATSSCAVETDPGLVGQVGDALGPEHRRELAKHAGQPPGRHHRDTVHEPCPRGPGRRERPRSGPPPRRGRPGPGRPGPPRSPPHRARGQADSGHATAAPSGQAGGRPDSAWSRSRTPHRGRSPGGCSYSC